MKRNIIGAVMCGGQSSRMGSDKGMLVSGDTTWAMLAFNKFRDIGIPAVISVTKNQVESYKKIITKDLLFPDCVDAFGPLRGILSIHQNFPLHDLFLLACDMKDIEVEHLNILHKSWVSDPNSFDCFLYKNDGWFEPLAGIYTSKFLSDVFLLNQKKEIADFSMQSIIRKGKTFEIEVSAKMKASFKNYNSTSEPGIEVN